MNRRTTLLSLLGGVTLAAAGYYFYAQNESFDLAGETVADHSQPGLTQKIGRYLPAFITEYLPDSFSSPIATEESASGSAAEQPVAMAEQPIQQVEATDALADQILMDAMSESGPLQESQTDTAAPDRIDAGVATAENDPSLDDQAMITDVENSLAGFLEQDQAENSLDEYAPPAYDTPQPVQIDSAENHTADKVGNENVREMRHKLASMQAELTTLNSENQQLETRFQDVLQQNKQMAQQLEEIDAKIQSYLNQ